MTITLTIERPSCTIELQAGTIELQAHRGERDSCGGVRGAGPALEPDEPAELEFIRATVDGNEIELHDEEIEQAEELAWEQKADQ